MKSWVPFHLSPSSLNCALHKWRSDFDSPHQSWPPLLHHSQSILTIPFTPKYTTILSALDTHISISPNVHSSSSTIRLVCIATQQNTKNQATSPFSHSLYITKSDSTNSSMVFINTVTHPFFGSFGSAALHCPLAVSAGVSSALS